VTRTLTPDRTFYAVSRGVVVTAGSGDYATISVYDADRGISVLYLHASSVFVSENAAVEVGTPLGIQGDTGPGVTGKHVHLEVRTGNQKYGSCGASISGTLNPELYIPQYLGAGGPDYFGYKYANSYCPGGPTYEWVDIRTTGTAILPDSDDQYVDGIAVGFFFNF